MRVVVLTKRQYTNRDVIDDRFGRLWEIPAGLAHQSCRVTCVCLSYSKKNSVSEEYESSLGDSVTWVSVNLGYFKVFGVLKYLWLANKIIREERPDVIWSCSDTIYNILGYYFSKIYRCRSIADLYDNFEYFGSYKMSLVRGLYRKAVTDSDGVSCVSENLSRHVIANYGRSKSTKVITNAVDPSVFRPMDKRECRERLGLPQDVKIFGSAGDLSDYRGADMMYRAVLEQAEQLWPAHLAVAGYRKPDTTIPSMENVHDLGMLPFEKVPAFLNSLDLAIVYNRRSSFGDYCFPQKFYEILACRIPIVAANVGELSVLLAKDQDLLYEDGDVASLARAIIRQLEARRLPDIRVPSWQEQADLLLKQIENVLASWSD